MTIVPSYHYYFHVHHLEEESMTSQSHRHRIDSQYLSHLLAVAGVVAVVFDFDDFVVVDIDDAPVG